jgi:para-aminobenzoate synthetase component I
MALQQYIFALPYIAPERVFAFFVDRPYAQFLDSNDALSDLNQFSFLVFDPIEKISHSGNKTKIETTEFSFEFSEDPFAIVQKRLKHYAEGCQFLEHPPVPFTGGALGLFGYDLGRRIEVLPSHSLKPEETKDMMIGLYDQVIAYDHRSESCYFIVLEKSDALAQARYQRMMAKFSNIKSRPVASAFTPLSYSKVIWTKRRPTNQFLGDIQKTLDYIEAGDIFQANLSLRLEAKLPENFDSYAHYKHLRHMNAAPFSAFCNFGATQISCCSPERFLRIDAKQKIETRPIKGTLSDHLDAEILRNSEKDRAENIMIVDLLRNDLSKICEDQSIDVPALCQIETYKGLHHLVSVVTGQLKNAMSSIDALRACFPGGSITGAPKIRAQEIIEELEPTRRGAYCGSIAYIDFQGQMDSNIVIRSLVYENNAVRLQIGSGIVADSDPLLEYQEMMLKAQKLIESFAETEDQDFETLIPLNQKISV